MGVINVTPDSFSDGAKFLDGDRIDLGRVQATAEAMIADGAAILDIGGESTRPGAEPVPLEAELARVIPVMDRLANLDTIVSIDTSKTEVAAAALETGAVMINDVHALSAPGMLSLAADTDAAVCVMHMRGQPRTMQQDPRYADVVAEVADFLQSRVHACREAGIAESRIVVDPGFGFGKKLAHNVQLLKQLNEIAALGYPVLAGLSRKRMLGEITGRPVDRRLAGGVAAAVLASMNGARIIRTHDVAATADALALVRAMRDA